MVERRETRALDATQVAAAALHPQNFNRLAGQRIDFVKLRAGIASAEVGDAQVGPQQIRPVAKQLGLIQ